MPLLLGLAASRVHDFDAFWQLQSGKYIWQTQSFITQDIFSLAADAPRFEHCWLHDLALYGVWRLGGFEAISLLKGVLITGTAAALVAAARLRGASWLSMLFFLPPTMLLTRGGWAERPQLWTFLFFALFLLVLERWRQQGGNVVYLLFPLMILWANLHAGSVLAFAVLAAYLVGEGGEMLLRRSRLARADYARLLGVGLLLGIAALLTPYGSMVLKTLVYAPQFGTQGGAGPVTALYNMDWRPTTFFNNPQFFYAIGVAGLLLALGWRRLTLTDFCLLAGLTLMGLKLSRHTHFLFFGAAALLPVYADAAVIPLLRRLGERARLALRIGALAAACWVAFFFLSPAWRTLGFFDLGLREWHFPVEAAQFVEEHKLPANLYNTYDWGGYLMWTLYPDYRVFWDQRQDSAEMFGYGLLVMAGQSGWEQVLDRFDVNTVVSKGCTVDTGQHYPVIDRLAESADWALVFADESSLIFVRRQAVPVDWLTAHELPASRIDDTILAEATLLTQIDPWRYMGWWEIARIRFARREYSQAFAALQWHLSLAPPGQHDPRAENLYRILYPMFNKTGTENQQLGNN